MKRSSNLKRLEDCRLEFDPRQIGLDIQILFVGESLPKKGYFYDLESPLKTLSKETANVFEEVYECSYGDDEKRKYNFLLDFQRRGFYLYDLFWKRAFNIGDTNEGKIKKAVMDLSDFIDYEEPIAIVTVIKRIKKEIQKAKTDAGSNARYTELPFPNSWWISIYKKGLSDFLNLLKSRK